MRKMILNGKVVKNEKRNDFYELGEHMKDLNKLGSLLGSYLRAIQANQQEYSDKKIDSLIDDFDAIKVKLVETMLKL